jgi:DNA-binding MarR family transcriptional regulator
VNGRRPLHEPDVATERYHSRVQSDPRSPTNPDPPGEHAPGEEPRGPHPADLIAAERRLHRRLRNRLNDGVEGLGLSYAQVELMVLLEARTNLHGGQMALALGMSRQAVHALVRKLELGGLVDVLPYDGGARAVALTDLGRRRLKMAWRTLGDTVHAALFRIPDAERLTLLESLEGCERALAPLRPPPWWLD